MNSTSLDFNQLLHNKDIDNQQLLHIFLSTQITDTKSIFALFSKLPNAIEGKGDNQKSHYVYIPGTREDRILLSAHADTIWDSYYKKFADVKPELVFEDGVFKNANESCGIGADDRAGCAMLWALRNSGHSLLILDGEEHGKIGARYLRKSNRKLFREINRHRMILELDTRGTNLCLLTQVDYTNKFANYAMNELKVKHDNFKGGSDLQILCHKVCGINIGVGYYKQHSYAEYLKLEDWENSLSCVSEFLKKSHPYFPISKKKRFIKDIKGILKLPLRVLRKIKRMISKK